MSTPSLVKTSLLCCLLFAQLQSQKTEEDYFQDFKTLMISLKKWKGLTEKEKQYRFGVYKKNLGVVSKPVPPPKDKFGRPLLGLVAYTYRKKMNKFAIYTDIEFENKFLMKIEILYKSSSSQQLRKNPTYSYSSFLRHFEGDDFKLDYYNFDPEPAPSPPPRVGTRPGNTPDFKKQFFPTDAPRFFSDRLLQQSELPPNVKRSVDWEHLFSDVFDQLDCNSCYATASISAVEAMHQKEYPQTPKFNLSVQEVLDCSRENAGCDGGQPSAVMQYLEKFGVAYAEEYPYKGEILSCKARYKNNAEKDQKGPAGKRILEQLLSGGPPRLLQRTRFTRFTPRFTNFRSNRIPLPQTTQRFRTNRFRNDRFSTNRFSNNQFSNRPRNFQSQFPRNNLLNMINQPRNIFNQTPSNPFTQRQSTRFTNLNNRPSFQPNFNTATTPRTNTRRPFGGTSVGSLWRNRSGFNSTSRPVSASEGDDLEDFDAPDASSQTARPAAPTPPPVATPSPPVSQIVTPTAGSGPVASGANESSAQNSGRSQNASDDLMDLEPLDDGPGMDSNSEKAANQSDNAANLNLPQSQNEDTRSQTQDSKNDDKGESAADNSKADSELEELEELSNGDLNENNVSPTPPSQPDPKPVQTPKTDEKTQNQSNNTNDTQQARSPQNQPTQVQPEKRVEEEQNDNDDDLFGFTDDLMDLDESPDEEAKPSPSPSQPAQPEAPKDDQNDQNDQNASQNDSNLNELESFEDNKSETVPQQKRYEKVKGFYFIRQNVVDLIRALQYGPVVVAHYVSEPFKFYEKGVFNGEGCEDGKLEHVNHASVIVGYNLDAKIPYFKFRNSWADDWGEKGHYRIEIGELTKRNKGKCLLAGTPFMVFAKVK